MLSSVSAMCDVAGGNPSPALHSDELAKAGGIIGWIASWPLVHLGAAGAVIPVAAVVLVFSLFIVTKTPPNRIGARLRELYAYLFGATLREREPKEKTATESLQFGTLGDLGLDDDDPPACRGGGGTSRRRTRSTVRS